MSSTEKRCAPSPRSATNTNSAVSYAPWLPGIGTELVIADLARDLGLGRGTVTNYVSILEAVYLLHLLPAFSTSANTAAKQRPKIQLVDSGLAAHLNRVGERDLSALSTNRLLGPMVEDRRTGRIAAIEMKASSAPDARCARHLACRRTHGQAVGHIFDRSQVCKWSLRRSVDIGAELDVPGAKLVELRES